MRTFQSVSAAARVAASAGPVLVALSLGAATAAEYCATCEGPASAYACTFNGVEAAASDTRLKLLCITELAKIGQHASCSVDRQQQTPCKGEIRQLALPSGFEINVPSAADAGTAAVPQSDASPAATPHTSQVATPPTAQTDVPKSASPPKTVKDAVASGVASTEKAIEAGGSAASEAAEATGNTLQKAGKAVGDAAKKTWDCITSFGSC